MLLHREDTPAIESVSEESGCPSSLLSSPLKPYGRLYRQVEGTGVEPRIVVHEPLRSTKWEEPFLRAYAMQHKKGFSNKGGTAAFSSLIGRKSLFCVERNREALKAKAHNETTIKEAAWR
ncbi:hypothetical protein IJ22_31530 [Paenibacillus naphthalenovorans]|uniref:Uncharacterized protein n=1 Tax=Paenibacillus naphthalenovorans TaxID=162209 RepID=A0A0U2VJJ7_9BACL|nr:hypothetical protein IJ22_31530 [Paenibacillus naphthalenovorans]